QTLRWTVVQQIPTSPKPQKNPKKSPKLPNFPNVVVLQKTFECPECGKTFGCRSHFSKHRRTHTG
ncbi:ZN572 protein, partial [Chloropsis cyanopogon]|nr:ZN572 protein [Chloropsis cyanopogon]